MKFARKLRARIQHFSENFDDSIGTSCESNGVWISPLGVIRADSSGGTSFSFWLSDSTRERVQTPCRNGTLARACRGGEGRTVDTVDETELMASELRPGWSENISECRLPPGGSTAGAIMYRRYAEKSSTSSTSHGRTNFQLVTPILVMFQIVVTVRPDEGLIHRKFLTATFVSHPGEKELEAYSTSTRSRTCRYSMTPPAQNLR